jgi:ParB family transcriptional regulator, chromosome partitioning protein
MLFAPKINLPYYHCNMDDINKDEQDSYSQAIFWIEVDKIQPNPYQPRKDFDDDLLVSLAESIRQYGVLQPLVVTRKEHERDDGGMAAMYELIAGERRLRAAKKAGISRVPCVIRIEVDNDKAKLEIAIIENVQREDLTPVDRARAFHQLAGEFNLKHVEIAKKIGRSREYVSNTIRLLGLPEEMLTALAEKKVTEGHSRPILMLSDRPKEQKELFESILRDRLSVRQAEAISRQIAKEKARRNPILFDRNTLEIEETLAEKLGTRVRIEKRENGGKILIDFFSAEDLDKIIDAFQGQRDEGKIEEEGLLDNSFSEESENDEDLYSVTNFTL